MTEIKVISPNDRQFPDLFGLYTNFFPPIERNTYEGLLGYYQKSDSIYQYETIAFVDNGQLVGGCYLNAFNDIRICVIEFLFVDEKHRGRGYARKMVQFARSIHPRFTFAIEVEKTGEQAQSFWKKMGFHDVENYDYVQPPINEGDVPFDGLKLMCDGQIQDIDDLLVNHYWRYSFA